MQDAIPSKTDISKSVTTNSGKASQREEPSALKDFTTAFKRNTIESTNENLHDKILRENFKREYIKDLSGQIKAKENHSKIQRTQNSKEQQICMPFGLDAFKLSPADRRKFLDEQMLKKHVNIKLENRIWEADDHETKNEETSENRVSQFSKIKNTDIKNERFFTEKKMLETIYTKRSERMQNRKLEAADQHSEFRAEKPKLNRKERMSLQSNLSRASNYSRVQSFGSEVYKEQASKVKSLTRRLANDSQLRSKGFGKSKLSSSHYSSKIKGSNSKTEKWESNVEHDLKLLESRNNDMVNHMNSYFRKCEAERIFLHSNI